MSSDTLPSISFASPVVFGDGSLVMSRAYSRPEAAGYPFHKFTQSGQWVESFGRETALETDDDARKLTLLLDGPLGDTFWASHRYDYVLEHWSKDGRLLEHFRRVIEWFPGRSEIRPVSRDAPPLPNVRSIQVHGDGLVRVLVTVADKEWRRGFAEAKAGGSEETDPVIDYHRVFDSIIEVIDPSRRTVIVSARFDQYLIGFIDDWHVAGYQEDEEGVPIIEVFQVALSNPKPGGRR